MRLPDHLDRFLAPLATLAVMVAAAMVTLAAAGSALAEENGRRWALLIGVNDYAKLNDLSYCSKDAKSLAEQLPRSGFAKANVFLMTDDSAVLDRPTKANIESRLEKMLQLVAPGDLVLISFSGHGVCPDGKRSYLCPTEARLEDPDGTMIPLAKVFQEMDASKASLKLMLIDACRDNPAPAGSRSTVDQTRSTAGVVKSLKEESPAGIVRLASCVEGQRSWEDETLGHGVFTHFVLEALSGKADEEGNRNGRVSFLELFDYVNVNTRAFVLRHKDEVQTPEFFGKLPGNFDIAESALKELVARFLVRKGNADGPALAGAEVALIYRANKDSPDAILGRGSSDGGGEVQLKVPAKFAHAQGGDFIAVVKHEGQSRRWPLPQFPEPGSWQVYSQEVASTSRPIPSPMPAMTRPTSPLSSPKEIANSIGMKLVLIPAGEFMMGSPGDESGRESDEGPQHRVRITKPFYLGKYEVTQEEYEKVMGENPSKFKGARLPVENVSWEDAVRFCERLSQKEGREYRLPTEAEWEYACRAGTATRFSFGESDSSLGDHAWYDPNSGQSTHPVGEKRPNAWGLYDMHGNVWEWCSDWYNRGYYGSSPVDDPPGPGPPSGWFQVFRGGSWFDYARYCRSARRNIPLPTNRLNYLGFRVQSVPAATGE